MPFCVGVLSPKSCWSLIKGVLVLEKNICLIINLPPFVIKMMAMCIYVLTCKKKRRKDNMLD